MFLPYHTMLFLPHPDQNEKSCEIDLREIADSSLFPPQLIQFGSTSAQAVEQQSISTQSSQTSSAFKLPPTYNPSFIPFHLNSINTSPPCLAPKQDQARLSEMLWRVKVSYLLLSPSVDRFDCWSIFAPLSRLVSTGLQKLRYYCQICEKQCRDV